MIAEALQYLKTMYVESTAHHKLETDDPRNDVYLVGGTLLTVPKGVAARNHAVRSLSDLIALAKRFSEADEKPAVWYDAQGLSLVIDDSTHRTETVAMDLEHSEVFLTLQKLDKEKPWLEQKPFVRLLRVELAGTLEPVHLLEKVRRVKFATEQSATGVVTRERESMGREINSRAETQEGAIPEEVTLKVPIYANPGLAFRVPIRCAVDVDPARGLFQLHPLPDALTGAVQEAVAAMAETLFNELPESVPAYHGRP